MMNNIKIRLATRLTLTAGLFVAVLALAQSTSIGQMDQNCESIGNSWTRFNCPYEQDQRRCLGLEIAYEASMECESIESSPGRFDNIFLSPAVGAVSHYMPDQNISDFLGDFSACENVCLFNTPAEISTGCCKALCQLGFGDIPTPHDPSSCPL
jgi:hypothetical protein